MDALVEDAVATALWQRVLDDFEDDATHAAFLEHSQRSGTLVAAATRYRNHRKQLDPDDDAVRVADIDKRLATIATLAIARLDAERSEVPEERRSHPTLIAISVLVWLLSLVLLYHALY